MAFEVFFTRRANRDVDEKENWLARLGTQAVTRWRARLFHAVEKLEFDALCYPRIDEADELGLDLREVLFGRRRHVYRVIFLVNEKDRVVLIYRIRHSAQDRLTSDDI